MTETELDMDEIDWLIAMMAHEALDEIHQMADNARAEIDDMLGFAPPF